MFSIAVNRLFTIFCFLIQRGFSSPFILNISDTHSLTPRTTRPPSKRQPLHCSLLTAHCCPTPTAGAPSNRVEFAKAGAERYDANSGDNRYAVVQPICGVPPPPPV
jgi:hypothetical protein